MEDIFSQEEQQVNNKPKKKSTWQCLRDKFPENECVLMQEVSDKSGFSRSRSLDYMVVNLWESRGLSITGIELKSNRSDWLRELKNPKKQENHFKYCDYFYLLTDNEGVASAGEIPEAWGWYHIKGSRIFTMKNAPKQNAAPVDRSFLCAMLRRAADKGEYVRIESIQDQIDIAVNNDRVHNETKGKYAISNLEMLNKQIAEFEKHTGLKINDWHNTPAKIGEAIKVHLNHGDDIKRYVSRLESTKRDVVTLLAQVEQSINNVKSYG